MQHKKNEAPGVETLTHAVLLAAGTSSRFGPEPKLLALLDGKPMIEHSVLGLKAAGIQHIIVVTGARSDAIAAALKNQQVRLVHNPDFASGMGSSLAAGVHALPLEADSCLICLGDMPFIRANTYRALIKASGKFSKPSIFTPTNHGKPGNPVLWRRSQFKNLANIAGDIGGRSLIQSQAHLVCDVPVEDPGIFIDLDTPAALTQFGVNLTN